MTQEGRLSDAAVGTYRKPPPLVQLALPDFQGSRGGRDKVQLSSVSVQAIPGSRSVLGRSRSPRWRLHNFSGCAKSSLEGDQYFHSFFSVDLPATEQEPEA